MRLSTKRIDQIVNISITVQQNIQGKLNRINYFKRASQGEIMIVLHLQKVTYSLSDEVSFFSDFQAFKSFLFMSRAFRKASCALRSSIRSASNVFFSRSSIFARKFLHWLPFVLLRSSSRASINSFCVLLSSLCALSTLLLFYSIVLFDAITFFVTAFEERGWLISSFILSISSLRCRDFSSVQATLIAP